jgi:hypothetical protein
LIANRFRTVRKAKDEAGQTYPTFGIDIHRTDFTGSQSDSLNLMNQVQIDLILFHSGQKVRLRPEPQPAVEIEDEAESTTIEAFPLDQKRGAPAVEVKTPQVVVVDPKLPLGHILAKGPDRQRQQNDQEQEAISHRIVSLDFA